MNLNNNLCECGCGRATARAKQTNRKWHHIKGQPVKFIPGHQSRGKRNSQWKGGIQVNSGYIFIHTPEHPRANNHGYVREHILMIEQILGRYLLPPIEVHHVNEIGSDNRNDNFVVCQDHAYHALIHRRLRAFRACGNANWRRCHFCHKYDDCKNMVSCQNGKIKGNYFFVHGECRRLNSRDRYHQGKLQILAINIDL